MKTKSPVLRIDRLLVAFAILSMYLAPQLKAQTNLVTWGVNGTTNKTSVGTSSVATGLVATSILQGPGVANASLVDAINGSNWTNTSQALALAEEDYFEFTIAPEANYVLTFSTLNANLRRSNTGPAGAAWVYSLDDYESNLASTNSVSTATGGANLAVSLSDTGITESVTFRLTGWGGANTGSFGIRATSSGANPTLNGTATLRSSASLVWDGGRGSGSWTAYNATDANQANWGGNNTPLNGDTLVFAGTTQTNTTNTVTSLLANAIVFSNTAGTFAVSGNALTVSNGITNLSANAQVFSNEVSLGAAQTFNASAGNLAFAGNVVNAGNALTVDGSANTAIAGVLSGVGGLVKSGAGTLTMSAINTFSGTTSVNAGRLVVDGTNASSAVTVGASGELGGTGVVGDLTVSGLVAPGNSVGTLEAGNTTFNTGGAFELEMWNWTSTAGTGWDLLAVDGDLTLSLSGAGAFTINLVSMESGTVAGLSENFNQTLSFTNTVVTFTGDLLGTAFEASLFTVNTNNFSNPFTGSFSIANIGQTLALVYTAPAAGDSYEWSAGSGNWSTGGNWTNTTAPPASGSKLFFSGAGGNSTNNAVATEVDGITFLTGAGAYVVEGDALEVGAFGILNESAATQTVDNALTLISVQTFEADAGDLVIGGTVDLDTYTLTVTGAQDVTMSGAISGTGGIVMSGSGNLTLGGANSYNGGTLVSAGTLIGTTTSLQGGITNASFVEFSQSTDGTYGGIITGAGAVVKSGAGNVTFSGANDYEGGTLVDEGTLTASTSSMPGDVEVSSGATFAISQATNGTFSGVIEGLGRFVKEGLGDVTLSGANTYSGGTLVSAGTLTGTASSLQGDITNNAAVVFVQTPDGTYDGAMSGSGSLTKSGAGTLTLSGANTYAGGTTVSDGTLAGTTGSLQGDIANSGTVRFDQTTTGSYNGELSGDGALVKAGSGAVTLEGANTYTGATTVESGSLIAADNNSLSSSAVKLSDGSVLAKAGVALANNFTIGTAGNEGSTITLQSWNFTGFSSPETMTATFVDEALDTDASLNTLTRGADAGASSASNSFRTTGFRNNGISLDNTDYFEWSLSSSASGFSLGTLDATFAGTGTFAASPGVSSQFAFSINGGDFTLIDSPLVTTGTPATMPQIDLTGITALQGLAAGTEVTFRYFASGQTTTGGWGFNSPDASTDGLIVQGALIEPGTGTGTLGISEAGSATFSGNVAVNNTATFTAVGGGLATFSGLVSGGGSVTKSGAGTVTLSGANTYIGGTTLSAGVLLLQSATAAGSGTITQADGTSTLVIDATGTVANAMHIYNISTLQTVTLSGNKTLANATFTVAPETTTTESGNLSGGGGMTKQGTGTLLVTGNNTFTGATAVNEGVLELASTVGGAAASTASVSVASGARLLISQSNQVNNIATVSLSGGTIRLGSNVSETFDSLNITGSGILDFGTATAGSLTFGIYQDNTTPSALLTLQNFIPGNSFTFINASFAANGSNIGSYFTFGDGFVNRSITDNGGSSFTITAIPEPSTYAAAIGLLGLMLWPSRKRLLKDAKKILGLTPPMRERLARRGELRAESGNLKPE
jgi:fibronectin-binding autotransporter adhesin